VVLSPVTFNNYGGTCNYQYPSWVREVEKPKTRVRPSGRAYQRYLEMKSFQNSKDRPYIHVVDGGVSDNLGVRGVLEALEELAMSSEFQGEVGFGRIRKVVLFVVDSHSSPSTDWDRRESPPGMVSQLLQASSVPIERYSFETVETMKDRAEIVEWRRELSIALKRLEGMTRAEAEASVPKVTLQVVNVSFSQLQDPEERAYFMNLPTTFVLPPEDIDKLRDVAGRLMRESADYNAILDNFSTTAPE
jgi:NTE family protein